MALLDRISPCSSTTVSAGSRSRAGSPCGGNVRLPQPNIQPMSNSRIAEIQNDSPETKALSFMATPAQNN